MLGLLFALVSESGCATARPAIKSLWQQVPPVRWTSSDSNAATSTTDRAAEPAVAANVAIQNEAASETNSPGTTVSSDIRPKSHFSRFGSRFNRSEPRTRDGTAILDPNGSEEAIAKTLAETDRSDSPLERLNAALTDDALQVQSLPQRSLTTLEDKIRVDSLLSRAKRMFEIGQLDQARQTAQLAQELGETAQLDYLPDEDRPEDLVRRIDGQLDATRLKEEPDSESAIGETPMPSAEDDAPPIATALGDPRSLPGKEPSGRTRMRRDWSMLFRREKKPAASEANPIVQTSKELSVGPVSDNRRGTGSTNRTPAPVERNAIVMANRSVSLGTLELPTEPSESVESGSSDAAPFGLETLSLAEPEMLDALDVEETPLVIIADSLKPTLESDEGVVLPEFDNVETVTPFHEVESTVEEPQQPVSMDSDETIRQSDWTGLYVVFGLCSLLALGCYRRGAT